jgi:hypothetical protein
MHPNILSEAQKELLPVLGSMQREFYLVGGTAIALQIGHRQSIDFDMFKKGTVRKEKISQTLRNHHLQWQVLFSDAEGFHILVNGVKLTFFQFPFDMPAKTKFGDMRMPDLLHLAAMKAYALGRRAKWKDYVDLFFLLRDHFNLEILMDKTITLFPDLFSPKLFKQQLCYFQDIDYSEEVTFMPGFEVSNDDVKLFLTEIASRSL